METAFRDLDLVRLSLRTLKRIPRIFRYLYDLGQEVGILIKSLLAFYNSASIHERYRRIGPAKWYGNKREYGSNHSFCNKIGPDTYSITTKTPCKQGHLGYYSSHRVTLEPYDLELSGTSVAVEQLSGISRKVQRQPLIIRYS
jgi:hypothetical protein